MERKICPYSDVCVYCLKDKNICDRYIYNVNYQMCPYYNCIKIDYAILIKQLHK